MKKFITLLVFLFAIQLVKAQQVKRLWESCYSDSATRIPTDMAVDASGNSYITGYIEETENYLLKHYFLIKNNSDGVMQWIKYFPVADSFDVGRAVTTDDDGNVYVTGDRYDTACNICTIQIPHSYLFTIKYDEAGNIVWQNYYDGKDSTIQQSTELSVDPAGVVYVIANEKEYHPSQGEYSYKMLTQKIDRYGNTVWLNKLADATGNGIAYDTYGNVLVAASYSPENIYQLNKFFVVKYKKNGDMAWARVFSEPGKNGNAYFVAADSAGNVYANGQTDTITFYNNPRILTIKYSPEGNLLWWKKEEDQSHTLPNFYGDYTIDEKGNSYLTGYVRISSVDRKWMTVKRKPGGGLAWKTYNDSLYGGDVPTGLEIDKHKNVYVTGYSYLNPSYEYTTIKYDKDGAQQWVKYYKNGWRSNNFPIGLGLDKKGNIYVAGNGGGATCTVKYGEKNTAPQQILKQPAYLFTLYPNPCTDVLILNTSSLPVGKYLCNVYNRTGQSVMAKEINLLLSKHSERILVSSLPEGLYTIHLRNDKVNVTQKFIKQ